ncbi:MAG: hypothetical protein PVI86_05290 [Phycisphaerae bacterium]|jgi:hypothetical protein
MRTLAQQTVLGCVLLATLFAGIARAAEMSVNDLLLSPGASGAVVVTGTIENELAFGVTIMVSITPRAGAVGSVGFTLAPPPDITQIGDPWPGAGAFDVFDTDITLSDALNAYIDDNGTFLAEATTFDGPIVNLPVSASADADGVWDVRLSTINDQSRWESVPTTIHSGIILVAGLDIVPAASTWPLVALTLSVLVAGTILVRRDRLQPHLNP